MKNNATRFYLAVAFLLLTAAERPFADDYQRTVSHVLASNVQTKLKSVIDPQLALHSGEDGFELIAHGDESLQMRISMIEAAEKTLDVQYYLIQDDITGKLILQALLDAGDRGVRVRILMDDLNMHSHDPIWILLNNHKNIELRIFNPFATRDESLAMRIKNVFTGLGQFSKRMHNKSLIVDNEVALTGGRNIGDAYFNVSNDFNFRDIDVMVIGPVVNDFSQSFDAYWNDQESFPMTILHSNRQDSQTVIELRQKLKANWQNAVSKNLIIEKTPITLQLANNEVPLLWARAELEADTPLKIDLPKGQMDSKPATSLNYLADSAKEEFIIVSPYFVPGNTGTQTIKDILSRGVKVRVLTNSLASTDAVAAHTGYSRYRQALVEEGVELYEMQPLSRHRTHSHRFSSSSRNSLHSKVFVVDRRDVIIGSFNLDPRSTNLNTEIVLIIHSPILAAQIVKMFDKATEPASSFHLVSRDHHLEWIGEDDNKENYFKGEPEAGFWRNVKADFFGMLPFEDQL